VLGSMLGSLYRKLIGKLFGVETLVQESVARQLEARVPESMRSEIAALLQGGGEPRLMLDVEKVANILASVSSAQYFLQHMLLAENLVHREALIRFAMGKCSVKGLVLEFGVYAGQSLRVIAGCTSDLVYGFDSFQGLPEDWTRHQKKGRFDLEGKLPKFEEPNVRLAPGWFGETLPSFLSEYAGPVRFLHVDCDLYRSAATVFTHLGPRIVSGSVIVFDEYFNYPGWEQHEFRAFQEFVKSAGLKYSYLGFASSYPSVAVQIT
jgi:hypothetical protein